jgi:hypothetical protein
MGIETVTQFAAAVDPSYREIFHETYKGTPQVRDRIFSVKPSSGAWEKLSSVSGLGLAQAKSELADITYDQKYPGGNMTFTNVTYALGFKISKEAVEDDRSSALVDSPAALAKSMVATKETIAGNVVNNAFGTTLCKDGLALCHLTHTASDGSARTWANTATAATLSHSAIISARTRMLKLTDERGIPIDVNPKTLLLPIDLEEKGFIFTKTERVAGSANWDKSLLENSGLTPLYWRFLSSTTAWFLLADKMPSGLIWFERIKAQFERDQEFDKQAAKWMGRERYVGGAYDWRCIDGNAGA